MIGRRHTNTENHCLYHCGCVGPDLDSLPLPERLGAGPERTSWRKWNCKKNCLVSWFHSTQNFSSALSTSRLGIWMKFRQHIYINVSEITTEWLHCNKQNISITKHTSHRHKCSSSLQTKYTHTVLHKYTPDSHMSMYNVNNIHQNMYACTCTATCPCIVWSIEYLQF